MALTPTVTKVSVTGSEEDIHDIKLNLKVNDGVDDVIDQDFTTTYRVNYDSRGVLRERLTGQMQQAIDDYKAHNIISESAALASDILTIQSDLAM